jgi:magnesium transporter
MLEGQINLYFAVQGQRMNEIMKILTIVSAIFIPLTFLAGIYGMNFDNIPELHYVNGYYVLLSVMLVISALLFWYFRRKGWLGGKS